MKYIDADKLKAEIKRRHDYENEMYHKKKPDGRPNEGWAESLAIMGVLEELLAFIDSLPEEPDKSLKEAAGVYARLDNEGVWKDGGKYKGFITGAEWQKEQMMKEAVEGFVATHLTSEGTKVTVNSGYLPKEMCIKPGDKVRIIIVKEEK